MIIRVLHLLSICIPAWGVDPQKPNIVFFLVDDLGLMDTSVPMLVDKGGNPVRHPLNNWYRTPNLERLAAQGIRFSTFYAHSVCSPTRISIMTGQNAARHRTTQFISPRGKNTGDFGPDAWNWKGLTSASVTLPSLLRKAGYRTIHVGKAHFAPPQHEGEDPLTLGFDVNVAGAAHGQPGSYFGEDGYGHMKPNRKRVAVPGLEKYHGSDTFLSDALTIEAKAEVDRAIEIKRPFFLYLSHYAVHSPFQSDPRFAENYSDPSKGKTGEAFATLVEGADKSLGDLMKHLEAKGVAENSLIIFLGDNGSASPFGKGDEINSSAPLRGKKATRWEGGVRVPFIAAWAKPKPNHSLQMSFPIQQGGIQQRMGICYDLFPTVLNLAGAAVPDGYVVDGHDLETLLSGRADTSRPDVFLSHFPHPHENEYFTSYREGNWKLIYNYFPDEANGLDRFELFDLKKDPSESVNLAREHPARARDLMRAMKEELNAMDALYPVVEGSVQIPQLP